jgi:Tfp pilus assembly protein PilN
MTIICGILLYGIFFTANAKDSQEKDEQFLEKEMGDFHSKMVQLLEKANAQKATIAQLRVTIEQQAKEVCKNKISIIISVVRIS